MKLKVDEQANALYLNLNETPAYSSEEVAPGLILDYDEKGHVVGIELLYLKQRSPHMQSRCLLFEWVPPVD
ncbi:MAG: DUF2283 domain-containing protein [Gloeomargarita sp. SKYB31]|nr:DUF2283 domain-containing protein [Gloeomargarita sp. SKYB31]